MHAPRHRVGWLGLIGFGLLLALLGVLFLQARQSLLLEQAIEAVDDELVVEVLQAELRFRQLQAAWVALPSPTAAAAESPASALLRERFVAWRGALERLDESRGKPLLAHEPAALATLEAASDFARRAALSLGPAADLPLDAA